MRRSSSSLPSNIAEGYGRNSNPQLSNFLQIAIGSNCELHYRLILSKDLSYVMEPIFKELEIETIEIRKIIFAYQEKL